MQEMFAALQLSAVEVATEVEMPLAVFNRGTHLVDWHLAIIHLSILNGSSGDPMIHSGLSSVIIWPANLRSSRLSKFHGQPSGLFVRRAKALRLSQLRDLRVQLASDTIVP